ncbi:MAG: DUF2155 domain-containing protein [Asticcacaulis sp.]
MRKTGLILGGMALTLAAGAGVFASALLVSGPSLAQSTPSGQSQPSPAQPAQRPSPPSRDTAPRESPVYVDELDSPDLAAPPVLPDPAPVRPVKPRPGPEAEPARASSAPAAPTPTTPEAAPSPSVASPPEVRLKPLDDKSLTEGSPTLLGPKRRLRHGSAVLQAVDKITAETMRFEARVGRPIRYRGLVLTVRACETTTEDERVEDVAAYLEVKAEPKARASNTPPGRQVFRGWMYARSPAVNAFSHPLYDVWVIDCRAPNPSVAGASR